MMKSRLLLFSLIFLFAFFNFSENDQVIIDWIKNHCYPINMDGEGFESDLGFLDEIQKGKRIISIGEEAHGISDFAKLRFEVFKYLVLHHGYTIYVVEDDFLRITALNKYLQAGEGNPREIMKTLYRSQANVTTLGMIEWMRKYNEVESYQSKKLKIYGYDCQRSEEALEELKKAFKGKNEMITFLDTVKLIAPIKHYASILSEQNLCILEKRIAENIEDKMDTSTIYQLFRTLKYSHLITLDKGNRDEFMAKNIQRILDLEGPNSKALVSAHNVHVGYKQFERRGQSNKLGSMGWHLKNHYSNELFTIWLDFNRGSFVAAEFENGDILVKTFTLPDAPQGSLSHLFSIVGHKAFFLNNSDIITSPSINEWFSDYHTMRYITAEFSEWIQKENSGMKKEKLLEHCDGVIFINEVEPYKLLKEY